MTHRLNWPRPSGSVWFAWRRHRNTYYVSAALMALIVIGALWQRYLLVAGVHGFTAACQRLPGHCAPDAGSPTMPVSVRVLLRSPSFLAAVPVVVSALIGAPLFARETEDGTRRLAWTQAAGRRSWVTARLTIATVLTALGTAALSAAVSWWWLTAWKGQQTPGADRPSWRLLTNWDDWSFFSVVGPVAVAHALLALLIGAVTGLLIGRMVTAVVTATLTSGVVLLGLGYLRPHLMPATLHHHSNLVTWYIPSGAWHLGEGYTLANGRSAPTSTCAAVQVGGLRSCLAKAGVTGGYTRDYTIRQFTTLQGVEAGICLLTTVVLVIFCLRYVERVSSI